MGEFSTELQKFNLADTVACDDQPEFPCEKEKSPIPPNEYQLLLEFVRGISASNLSCSQLRERSKREPNPQEDPFISFLHGGIKELCEIALSAREVLKQIGEV